MRQLSLRVPICLIVFGIGLVCGAPSLRAQLPAGPNRVEVGASYDWTRANAPAGQCVCFSLNGGTGTVAWNLTHAFGVVGEVGGNHQSNLNGTSQNVPTYTYLAGARYAVPAGPRVRLFGQAMFGTTHEASNYAYVADKSAFTFGFGGGVHVALRGRVGFNLVQLDWLHSTLPNGTTTSRTICASVQVCISASGHSSYTSGLSDWSSVGMSSETVG